MLTEPTAPPVDDPKKTGKESKNSREYISLTSRRVGTQIFEHAGAGLPLTNFSPAFGSGGEFVSALSLDGFLGFEASMHADVLLFTQRFIQDLPSSYVSDLGPEGAFQLIRNVMAARLATLAASHGND